jgi:hypothetical protein
MHRKNSTLSLHRDRVQKALSKIEADLIDVRTAHEHSHGFENLDRTLSSHPCPELTQVYGLLLKGDTWAEVAERVDGLHSPFESARLLGGASKSWNA